MQSPYAVGLPDGAVAFAAANFTTLTGREIYLHVIEACGIQSSTLVTSTGVAQDDTGINDLAVGTDGTILLSVNDNDVYRYGLSEKLLLVGDEVGEQNGTAAADLIIGGAGNDRLSGQGDNDQIEGHGGNDQLSGLNGGQSFARWGGE